MRVGVTTACCYSVMETEDAVVDLQKYGVPCCEVFLETFTEYDPEFGKLIRGRLGGMEAVSIHCRTQHFDADFLGRSERQRKDGYFWLNRALDAGREIGAKIWVYHGPMVIRGKNRPIKHWAADLNRANELAMRRGLRLCWETVSWCAINSPGRVREAAEHCPDIGFVLDIKQVIETGFGTGEYIAAMGSRLKHVHALDYDANGNYALPGRGITDFAKLRDELLEVGYDGDIILEPYSEQAANEANMRASLDYLRGIFEK